MITHPLRRAPRLAPTAGLALVAWLASPIAARAEPAAAPPPPPAAPAAPATLPAPPAMTAPPVPSAPAAPPVASAPAAPSFEIVDRGDAVEVIARNVKAARTAILPMRSRLEIPIVGAPFARRLIPVDPTVKIVELDSEDAVRVLSVKLGFDRPEVKALARFAQAIQVGDDLHVLVPRKLPTDGLAPRLPDPTMSPALAAAVARADQTPGITLGPRPDPAPPRPLPSPPPAVAPEPAPAATPAAIPDATPAAAPVLGPQLPRAAAPAAPAPDAITAHTRPDSEPRPPPPVLAPSSDDSWSKIAMYGALGLAAAGAGIWILRHRRAQLPAAASIEIVAQRALGGKARLVWLSAGPHEMIVSVTAQQINLLGQWPRSERPAALAAPATGVVAAAFVGAPTGPMMALPFAHTVAESRDARVEPRSDPADRALSPAVSGILRLRGLTGQMPIVVAPPAPEPTDIADDVASGDVEADQLWVKEILAATGARR
jgi:flagellar biosynthesis protein FliO